MIGFYCAIKCRIRVIKSDVVVFESVGTGGDINVEEILTISNLVPEIKSSCSVWADELLGVDEISDDWLDSKLLDKLSSKSFFSALARLKCSTWETIKPTSTRSICRFGEE